MRSVRIIALTTLTLGLVLGVSGTAHAAPVGDWGLNESPGANLAIDSSGQGLHGSIGDDVVLGEATEGGGKAYRFRGDWWVPNDERLVLWQDDARLDPGSSPYAVTIRIKTGAPNTNLVQKGQANQTGGFWKLEVHNGKPTCHFTDVNRRTRAIGFQKSTDPRAVVSDGQWHTLRCERTSTGVRMTIDYGQAGAISNFLRGTLGWIDNKRPLSLGGKVDCDYVNVTCDYFAGAVDWMRIDKG